MTKYNHPEPGTYHLTESGAVTNVTVPKHTLLFVPRTIVLLLTWCVTDVAMGLDESLPRYHHVCHV